MNGPVRIRFVSNGIVVDAPGMDDHIFDNPDKALGFASRLLEGVRDLPLLLIPPNLLRMPEAVRRQEAWGEGVGEAETILQGLVECTNPVAEGADMASILMKALQSMNPPPTNIFLQFICEWLEQALRLAEAHAKA